LMQLTSLERRTSRAGKDSIDHAPGAHDDVANAVAGALVTAYKAPGDPNFNRKLVYGPAGIDVASQIGMSVPSGYAVAFGEAAQHAETRGRSMPGLTSRRECLWGWLFEQTIAGSWGSLRENRVVAR
jgi:hypothetical protein